MKQFGSFDALFVEDFVKPSTHYGIFLEEDAAYDRRGVVTRGLARLRLAMTNTLVSTRKVVEMDL